MIHLVTWLTFPISENIERFKAFRLKLENELAHDGSVLSLEKYLNDRFDIDLRRIIVKDVALYDYPVFRKHNNGSVIFRKYGHENKVILRTYKEMTSRVDFIIEIDNTNGDLNPDLEELKACVDLRKLPSMQYEIVIKN